MTQMPPRLPMPTWLPERRNQGGFKCPDCGKAMSVGDSRQAPGGSIRRRRYCVCGNRVTTYESQSEIAPKALGDLIADIGAQFEEIEIRLAGVFRAITAAYAAFNHDEGAMSDTDIRKHPAGESIHPVSGSDSTPVKDQGVMGD